MLGFLRIAALYLLTGLGTPTLAAPPCGGSFDAFVRDLGEEARAQGHSRETVRAFFDGVRQDQRVLEADRSQSVFQRPFVEFSGRLISQSRLDRGRALAGSQTAIFDRIEATYGVPRGVLLAFWAFETDYGAFQGNFNTRDALVTLAHDCRRPELFRPQALAAIDLFARGGMDPQTTTGAWAGEIGMVQMLPRDILENGIDGDGDGVVSLKSSAADALTSGARMLSGLGWQAGAPWLQEVIPPLDLDWSLTGLGKPRDVADWYAMGVRPRGGAWLTDGPVDLLLPQGHEGPAFVAYPNFNVFFEWNQSFVYVLTAAYFATRLDGAPRFELWAVMPGLDGDQMRTLQRKLQARGHDVGKIDGILGARTRAAVQAEQVRLGLPADAWPTPELLDQL